MANSLANHPIPNKIDWRYLAAIVDGRGSLCQYYNNNQGKACVIQINFTGLKKPFLLYIRKYLTKFGIHSRILIKNDPVLGYVAKSYTLRVTRVQSVLKVLYNIEPFCVSKRHRIRELLSIRAISPKEALIDYRVSWNYISGLFDVRGLASNPPSKIEKQEFVIIS